MKLIKLIEKMEQIAPPSLALDWDNVGLLVGDIDKNVKKVVLSVDATEDVISQAIEEKADLIITHHPLIFKGLKRVSSVDMVGKRILKLAEHKIALYSMHTNFDVAVMADYAATKLELSNSSVLDVTTEYRGIKFGIGKVGVLGVQSSLKKLAELVKKTFSVDMVQVYGNLSDMVDIVAICPGSGKDMVDNAIAAGAQVLITGDIDYHTGLDAVNCGLNIINVSHFGLEKIFIEALKCYFALEKLPLKIISSVQGEPFEFI